MTIKINENIISKLLKEGFYPDNMFSAYFVLKALSENQPELLDKYDDYNSSKRAVIIYQTLYRKGLIEKAPGDSKIYFKLTQKAVDLMDLINALTAEAAKPVETSKDWIKEWIELFPIRGGKRLLRMAKGGVQAKMDKFLNSTEYGKDIIFTATKSYIMSEADENFKYCLNSSNFISHKEKGSQLEAWCQLVKEKIDSGGAIDDGSHVKLLKHAN